MAREYFLMASASGRAVSIHFDVSVDQKGKERKVCVRRCVASLGECEEGGRVH
jgi:hypothetical protein